MSLQFIMGSSGTGKSHYIYERVIQEAGEHPDGFYYVIVPEQFTCLLYTSGRCGGIFY